MTRHGPYSDLEAVRALVADGRAGLGDTGKSWRGAAGDRLAEVDAFVVSAAGGLPWWVRSGLEIVATFAAAWAVAAAGTAIGLGPAWVIGMTPIPALTAAWAATVGLARLDRLVNRRRMAPERPVRAGDERPLTEVPESLLRARGLLVSAALRRAGPRRWRAADLTRLMTADRSIHQLANADIVLCLSIDMIERHLALPEASSEAGDPPDEFSSPGEPDSRGTLGAPDPGVAV
jgi:hypothetical protein